MGRSPRLAQGRDSIVDAAPDAREPPAVPLAWPIESRSLLSRSGVSPQSSTRAAQGGKKPGIHLHTACENREISPLPRLPFG